MKKYLLIYITLCLSACVSSDLKFKKDDCFKEKNKDIWETQKRGKIVEVGLYSYKTTPCMKQNCVILGDSTLLEYSLSFKEQNDYEQVSCNFQEQ